MASCHGSSKHDKFSIKYLWIPLDVQCYEPNTIVSQKYALRTHAKGSTLSETKSPIQGASTAKFVSAVARIWDYAGDPAVFHSDESLKYHDHLQKECNTICYSGRQRKQKPTSTRNGSACNGLEPKSSLTSAVKSYFEEVKCIKKQLLLAACNRYVANSFSWKRVWLIGSHSHIGNDKVTWSTTRTVQASQCESIDKTSLEDLKDDRSIGTDKQSPFEISATQAKGNSAAAELYDASCDKSTNLVGNDLQISGSFYSTYSLRPMMIWKGIVVGFCRNHRSSLHFGNNFDFLTLTGYTYGRHQKAIEVMSSSVSEVSRELSAFKDCDIHECGKSLAQEPILEHKRLPIFTIHDKLEKELTKNRHAIAGALAGTIVSLCLHPIDTIKTIIQADGIGQKSVYCTLRTLISEKGIAGLYCGITTNIASSALISAIYTFTYESVKGALLPVLPKEYHSVVHCFAGGCSSIATSLIFTPSERIKQQMQVGSQYQDCWNAFIGCFEKGGLPSLYTGWKAVLCRNIPHSIIKFYTYENLKLLCLVSAKPNSGLSTLQTLMCGGIAGSTAALFTTPFDVVKTKLQTQAPGTIGKYSGVLHALQEIARQEGFQGLYRGVTPRLAMYISQGALFFASYEFLKVVFALQVPQSHVQVIHNQQNADYSKLRSEQTEVLNQNSLAN
ncbi:uncharacterized protein LOC135583063 isoform X1 [Musa acuminata AAA Group]|uniref:uncharacterized protein LOC135583063 isoform X1 n=1 Tax=Musa acuminata AAA Group TaxID=214697 RepID=UPI0031E1CC62